MSLVRRQQEEGRVGAEQQGTGGARRPASEHSQGERNEAHREYLEPEGLAGGVVTPVADAVEAVGAAEGQLVPKERTGVE